MKKDANEFAHLIKAFKGGAEYMWTNFDHVMLNAIYSECIAIDDDLQRDINASKNKVSRSEINNGTATFAFTNLEDIPATEEEQRIFDEFVKKQEEIQKQRNLVRIQKVV